MKDIESALFIESVAGIAGDMFTAACADAKLVEASDLEAVPGLLGFSGVSVQLARTSRAHLAATQVRVSFDDECWERFLHEHPSISANLVHNDDQHGRHSHGPKQTVKDNHRHVPIGLIEALFEESSLSSEITAIALAIFRELAAAEAAAHGIESHLVQFHEVGRIDSIVDAAMAGLCLARIAPQKVYASPVKLGRGSIKIAHGTYPIPPPASAVLCRGFPVDPVPEGIDRRNLELSTPTGLAILKVLSPEFVTAWPAGRPVAHGYGAGSMDLKSVPNVTRITLFEVSKRTSVLPLPYEQNEIVEIVCNLDDQSPERSAWLLEKALEQGALDVWITPVTGKKNRPAHLLSMLASTDREQALIDWILRSSSTFGLRRRKWDKFQLARKIETRDTPYGKLRYKIGMTTEGEVLKEKPEHDDLARIWESDPGFKA